MFVIGTAGHVDHGKTRLIEALTGIDADRLPEEKRRGLTIDLGFAHFVDAHGSPIGVIDVPGHERFIRNMVAGAWSLCCGLLTVAADDGWMRQSTDHTRVLKAMGVPRLVVVITKIDAADSERVERVHSEAITRCARLGYPKAPTVSVSAVTGANIEQLRRLILTELDGLRALQDCRAHPAPQTVTAADGRRTASPFVYIDRVFSVRGAGVVVTGSLTGAELARETELELLPLRRRVRVRSIQAYYEERDRVAPVCRVALNLAGVKAEDISRGNALSLPGAAVWAEEELIVRLVPTRSTEADDLQRTIRRQGEAEVAVGTGHYRVRLRALEAPGAAHVVAEQAIPVRWNEPFVFIRQGGSSILGSGHLLWPGPTTRTERRRIAALLAETPAPAAGPVPASASAPFPGPAPPAAPLPTVAAVPPAAAALSLPRLQLAMRGYLRAPEAKGGGAAGGGSAGAGRRPGATAGVGAAGQADAAQTVRRGDWILLPETLRELEEQIRALAGNPGGLPVSELGSRFRMEQEMLVAVCTHLVQREELALRSGVLLPRGDPQAGLSPMGRQLLEELRAAGDTGLQLDRLKARGSAKEMRVLARAGLAVSLDANIYYDRDTYAALTNRILTGLAPGDRLPISEAKARSGLTRKYIIPLLNRMQDDGWVRREGDERVVTRAAGGETGARTSDTQTG